MGWEKNPYSLVNIRTVHRILKADRQSGQVSAKKNSGRPPKATEKSKSTSRGLADMCPITSKQLKANWSDGHKHTDSHIRRILCKYGLFGRRTKVTFLT